MFPAKCLVLNQDTVPFPGHAGGHGQVLGPWSGQYPMGLEAKCDCFQPAKAAIFPGAVSSRQLVNKYIALIITRLPLRSRRNKRKVRE